MGKKVNKTRLVKPVITENLIKVTAEFVIRIPRGPPWLTIQNCARAIRKGGELTLYQTKLLQSTLKLEPKRKKHLRCRNRIFIALVSRKKTSGIMKYLNIHSILLYVHPTHIGMVVKTQNKKRSLFPLSHPLFFCWREKKNVNQDLCCCSFS